MHRNSKEYKKSPKLLPKYQIVKITVQYITEKQEFIEYTNNNYSHEFYKIDEIERLYKMNSRPLLSTNTHSIENRFGLSVSFPIYDRFLNLNQF